MTTVADRVDIYLPLPDTESEQQLLFELGSVVRTVHVRKGKGLLKGKAEDQLMVHCPLVRGEEQLDGLRGIAHRWARSKGLDNILLTVNGEPNVIPGIEKS